MDLWNMEMTVPWRKAARGREYQGEEPASVAQIGQASPRLARNHSIGRIHEAFCAAQMIDLKSCPARDVGSFGR